MDRFFIGLTLPDEFSSSVDKWRAKFYPKAVKRHPPHITVHSVFACVDPETLVKALELLSGYHQPLTVKISGYGAFPNERNVLHLKVEASPELLKLHQDLLSATGNRAKWQFNPHITIAKLPDGELKSAIRVLDKEDLNWEFAVEEVVLFKEKPDLSWEVWRKFRLGY